jgi:ubiquinone/menaquinone biosynthesis C-methylase UbiE
LHEKHVDARVVQSHFDALAPEYDAIKRKNSYYHELLKRSIAETVPPGRRVLEIGTATGEILNSLSPSFGVGIDLSANMIEIARQKFPRFRFEACSFERFNPGPGESFDYIVLADVIEHIESPAKLFSELRRLAGGSAQIVLTMANPFWEPLLGILEALKFKMQEGPHFRISERQIVSLAADQGFRLARREGAVLVPVHLGRLSDWINRRAAHGRLLNPLTLIVKMVFEPS